MLPATETAVITGTVAAMLCVLAVVARVEEDARRNPSLIRWKVYALLQLGDYERAVQIIESLKGEVNAHVDQRMAAARSGQYTFDLLSVAPAVSAPTTEVLE